jgi:hypothetical protein
VQNFTDPKVSVMVVVSALVSFLILLPAAHLLGRRIGADAAVAVPTAPEIARVIKRSGSE